MGYYINQNGGYYEGDRQGEDQEVPQRPDSLYIWNGSGWIIDQKKLSANIAAVKDAARVVRERIFAALAGLQAEALSTGDSTTALAIHTAQAQLRDITINPALLAATTPTQAKAAIMDNYRVIVAGCPANVRTAFAALAQ